ncbi:MAG: peroxiredoxin [Cytophagales bacterium]|nr:peroxiredoxin [Cytophagales bacterium]
MTRVGKKAPNFSAPAVVGGGDGTLVPDFGLSQYLGRKDVLLFFYPKDFTFVCPTEIIAFQESLSEFEERSTSVVGVSTDTEETHLAWLKTPRKEGGIEGVTYPLVADTAKTISADYGVLGGTYIPSETGTSHSFKGIPIAFRGTFLIDKEGVIRHESVNDLPLGRNIHEYLRLIDAMHHVDEYGEVCPADWAKGESALSPTREGVSKYLASKSGSKK